MAELADTVFATNIPLSRAVPLSDIVDATGLVPSPNETNMFWRKKVAEKQWAPDIVRCVKTFILIEE